MRGLIRFLCLRKERIGFGRIVDHFGMGGRNYTVTILKELLYGNGTNSVESARGGGGGAMVVRIWGFYLYLDYSPV